MILVLLQNAWSKKPRKSWARESWLKALARSRTGQRLQLALKDLPTQEIHFENTTPEVGEHSGSALPPNQKHLEVIFDHSWDLVIACGRQAEEASLRYWKGRLLVLPHPCYRVATNALFLQAGFMLKNKLELCGHQIALRQERGAVRLENFR